MRKIRFTRLKRLGKFAIGGQRRDKFRKDIIKNIGRMKANSFEVVVENGALNEE